MPPLPSTPSWRGTWLSTGTTLPLHYHIYETFHFKFYDRILSIISRIWKVTVKLFATRLVFLMLSLWEQRKLESQNFEYEGVSKSFRTDRLERILQMIELSATRCSCIAILWASLVSSAALTLCVASQRLIPKVSIYFVIDSVRKLLDTPSYFWGPTDGRPSSFRFTTRSDGDLKQGTEGSEGVRHSYLECSGMLEDFNQFYAKHYRWRMVIWYSSRITKTLLYHSFSFSAFILISEMVKVKSKVVPVL
jgi:hypothetical protein